MASQEENSIMDVSLTAAKANRKKVRKWITRIHNSMSGGFGVGGVTPEILKKNFDLLMDCDEFIEDGDNSDSYIKKAAEINRYFEQASSTAAKDEEKPTSRSSANHCGNNVQIMPFSGDSVDFPQYEALFNMKFADDSLVNRFCSLKLAFGEHASSFIKCQPPTEEGYAAAQAAIRKHYLDGPKIRCEINNKFARIRPISSMENVIELRKLYELAIESFTTLKYIDTGTEYLDETFFNLITKRLPYELVRSYFLKNKTSSSRILIEFLKENIDVCAEALEKTESSRHDRHTPSQNSRHDRRAPSHQRSETKINFVNGEGLIGKEPTCRLCEGRHRTIKCTVGDANSRRDAAVRQKLCFRCLCVGHRANECRSKFICRCGEPHSLVLCRKFNRSEQNGSNLEISGNMERLKTLVQDAVPVTSEMQPSTSRSDSATIALVKPGDFQTYYKTCNVRVNGEIVRVLLDDGAGRSLIRKDVAKRLNLPSIANQRLNVSGAFNIGCEDESCELVAATLESTCGDEQLDVYLNVVSNLAPLRLRVIDEEHRNHLKNLNIELTDTYEGAQPIDLILGLDYTGVIWSGVEKRILENVFVRKSMFGWVCFGTFAKNEDFNVNMIICESNHSSSQKHSDVVKYIEKYKKDNIKFVTDHYEVKLPWQASIDANDNKDLAWRRFWQLVNNLEKRKLFDLYDKEMKEMIGKYAERVDDQRGGSPKTFYLPHFCVVRPDKATTKVRIVLDGAAHLPNTRSVNDNLYKGSLSWNSFELLLKFRFGETAVQADIEKAFLAIHVDKEDRDATRFFWFDDEKRVTIYRMTRVAFGLTSSPFILNVVIEDHLDRFGHEFREIVDIIRGNFYVDDLLKAMPKKTTEELIELQNRIVKLFATGGMHLRKWRTNLTEVDAIWSPGASEPAEVLGHVWNVANDEIGLSSVEVPLPTVMTKRVFASVMSSIYDPLGWLAPVTVELRLLLRAIWKADCDWDSAVNKELSAEARSKFADIHRINEMKLKRNCIRSGDTNKLIVFCDASKSAIGVVTYVKNSSEQNLLMAKSKLSKTDTIPELELEALVYANKLAKQLNQLFEFDSTEIYSDSLLNLQRLEKPINHQKPHIALKIQSLKNGLNVTYRHVDSKENIADLVSRGCPLSALLENQVWRNGPKAISSNRYERDIVATTITADDNEECRKPHSYLNQLNVFRNVVKFCRKLRNTWHEKMSIDECARLLMIRSIQEKHLKVEIDALMETGEIPKQSVWKNFALLLDEFGIVRLRTRFEKAESLSIDQRFPIVLPTKCSNTKEIIRAVHVRSMHSGNDRVQGMVRENYFVLKLKKLVKQVQRECIVCRALFTENSKPNLGPLPPFRVDVDSPAFANCGIDICGPLKIQLKTKAKVYLLIFACAVSRAIRLIVLNNETAEEVFMGLRMFIAQNGLPRRIYSDRGTNLVCVRRQLKKLIEELRETKPNFEIEIEWLLQTSYSPWRGAFYERMNRTVKRALMAITFRKVISDRELAVVVAEIEAHINSRPLFVVDGEVVTPEHFRTPTPLPRFPAIGNVDRIKITSDDLPNHFIRSQRASNAVKRLFTSNYISELRLYHQNPAGTPLSYQVGDVVLLKNENSADRWPMAKITKIFVAPDGIVRTIETEHLIKLKRSFKKEIACRAVQNVQPLECSYMHDDRLSFRGGDY